MQVLLEWFDGGKQQARALVDKDFAEVIRGLLVKADGDYGVKVLVLKDVGHVHKVG